VGFFYSHERVHKWIDWSRGKWMPTTRFVYSHFGVCFFTLESMPAHIHREFWLRRIVCQVEFVCWSCIILNGGLDLNGILNWFSTIQRGRRLPHLLLWLDPFCYYWELGFWLFVIICKFVGVILGLCIFSYIF